MWTDRQTEGRTDGPTDRRTGGRTTGRHDEDNSRFSQFCEERPITDFHLLHCSSFVARIQLSLSISHIISAYARSRFGKQLWSSKISPVSPLVYSLCVHRLARLPAAFLHMTRFTVREFQRAREVFTTMWLSGA